MAESLKQLYYLEGDFAVYPGHERSTTLQRERERNILMLRFFNGKTQMEVADSLDISQAQVSRLEKKAIKELKKVLK